MEALQAWVETPDAAVSVESVLPVRDLMATVAGMAVTGFPGVAAARVERVATPMGA